MSINVSDSRSNSYEQVEFAVKKIGKSKDKLAVFDFIYRGKKAMKTVAEISEGKGLSTKRVLEAGKYLAKNSIIKQIKHQKRIAYEKDSFYSAHKSEIIKLVGSPEKLSKLPSKRNNGSNIIAARIVIPRNAIDVKQLQIDDIDSFKKIKSLKRVSIDLSKISEKKFKLGVQSIIGEKGKFTDWGGEGNDLLSTRIVLKGSRIQTAFAFKGPGRKGKLTPAKMGKNGDQIQRLFKSPANMFILQYWDQIDDSVYEQMESFARVRSIADEKRIYYCVIDGQDTARIVAAYPKDFFE
jgi:hypothetical protein